MLAANPRRTPRRCPECSLARLPLAPARCKREPSSQLSRDTFFRSFAHLRVGFSVLKGSWVLLASSGGSGGSAPALGGAARSQPSSWLRGARRIQTGARLVRAPPLESVAGGGLTGENLARGGRTPRFRGLGSDRVRLRSPERHLPESAARGPLPGTVHHAV